MGRSLADANKEIQNHGATHDDFPKGTRVSVSCVAQDFHFFKGDGSEKATVTKNDGGYLGIIVEFDNYVREGETKPMTFNFNPEDLRVIEQETMSLNYCPQCGCDLEKFKQDVQHT